MDAKSGLLVEHGNLALIVDCAAADAAGGADDGQNGEGFERGAGHKNALGIGALVGRAEQEAFWQGVGEVGGHQAFEHFVVLEAQADPEAFRAGAGGESFAGEGFGVAEFPDEVDALDFAEIHQNDVPRGVEQFEFAFVDELPRGDVAGDGVAVHLADDHFFVRRRHKEDR